MQFFEEERQQIDRFTPKRTVRRPPGLVPLERRHKVTGHRIIPLQAHKCYLPLPDPMRQDDSGPIGYFPVRSRDGLDGVVGGEEGGEAVVGVGAHIRFDQEGREVVVDLAKEGGQERGFVGTGGGQDGRAADDVIVAHGYYFGILVRLGAGNGEEADEEVG